MVSPPKPELTWSYISSIYSLGHNFVSLLLVTDSTSCSTGPLGRFSVTIWCVISFCAIGTWISNTITLISGDITAITQVNLILVWSQLCEPFTVVTDSLERFSMTKWCVISSCTVGAWRPVCSATIKNVEEYFKLISLNHCHLWLTGTFYSSNSYPRICMMIDSYTRTVFSSSTRNFLSTIPLFWVLLASLFCDVMYVLESNWICLNFFYLNSFLVEVGWGKLLEEYARFCASPECQFYQTPD